MAFIKACPVDLALLIFLFFCLYTDLREQKIYNKAVFGSALLGLALNFYLQGPGGLLFALKGFLLGTALLFLPFAAGGLGAGDVKLLGIVGLMKGVEFVFSVFLLSALAGGILALVSLAQKRKLFPLLKGFFKSLYLFILSGARINTFNTMKGVGGENTIPYAPAIVIGVVLAYLV